MLLFDIAINTEKKSQISCYSGSTIFYLYQKISSTTTLNLALNKLSAHRAFYLIKHKFAFGVQFKFWFDPTVKYERCSFFMCLMQYGCVPTVSAVCFTGLSLTLYFGFFGCPPDSDLQSDGIYFGYFDGLLLSAGLPVQPTGWKHVIRGQGGKREFST